MGKMFTGIVSECSRRLPARRPRTTRSSVQAPRWIRSPSRSGTAWPGGISLPLTAVPLAEPGSTTDQVPSAA